ncbi:MAG TPA: tetratricopeptide repeat protein [Gemmataceae bacterium]
MGNLLHKLQKHPRITTSVLALAVFASGAVGLHLWKEYHLRAARQALDSYAFEEAQRHLNQCLAIPFRNDAVYLLAAQTARRRDSYQESSEYLAACQQEQGITKAVALERLLLAAQQGELDGVEGPLRDHLGDEDPESVLILEALAKGYYLRCWRTEALECLNKLLHLQPGHPQALLLRARLKEEMNPDSGADVLGDYEKVLEVTSSFEARLGRARALYRLGRPLEALVQYQLLLGPGEADAQVLLGLARCRFNLGEVDAVRMLLEELLQQHPDQWEAFLERGRLELHAGQATEAEKWLRRAVDLAPRCEIGPLRALGQCLQSQHKDEEARDCFARLDRRQTDLLQVDLLTFQANRDPSNVALRYEIADKLMHLDRVRDRVAVLYHVLDQQPRHGPAHAALADYFEQLGQPDLAARHRRAATQTIPAR